ncbi:MAG: glycosyltransferase family 2 protein [Gammaproteobacteria bacterium]|jgi:glycosyltransferase involved in cell wall biosynthesis
MAYTLSVIIPCYNEKATINTILEAVARSPVENQEIIVVDDYSTDGTRELLQNELRNGIDVLVLHEVNQGKGAAIRSGFEKAGGDFVIIQDADLEYDPDDYAKLLAPMLEGKADVVYGSRFLGGDSHRVLFFWHSMGNRFLTFMCNMFSNLNLTDMETCYKLFRRDIVRHISLEEDRFGFEPEITLKISRIPNIRIYEVGIAYYGRTYEEGKKIGWKDGVRALYCILKYGIFIRG